MKRQINYLFLMILIATAISSCGPSVMETSYMDGKIKERYEYVEDENGSQLKNGLYTGFYPNGQVFVKEYYLNNKKDGEAIFWSEEGVISRIVEYKEGNKNGLTIRFNEKGDTSSIVQMNMGKVEGLKKTFFENNMPRRVEHIKDGKYEGLVQEYYKNGKLKDSRFYIDGKNDGVATTYFDNGQVNSTTVYNNGKRDGTTKEFNDEGVQIKSLEWSNEECLNILGKWKKGNGDIYEFTDAGVVLINGNKKSYSIGSAVLKIGYFRHVLTKFIDGEIRFNEEQYLGKRIPVVLTKI